MGSIYVNTAVQITVLLRVQKHAKHTYVNFVTSGGIHKTF